MRLSDPVFLEAIRRLQEDNPNNYEAREIDLYNGGKDAINQQVAIIGNVLQVLDFPEYCEIFIRFNEITNSLIRLKKGIFLFTFYRLFLSYKHTDELDSDSQLILLKFLIGKDIISVEYPTPIEKASLEFVPAEYFLIPKGAGRYLVPCKHAFQYPEPSTFHVGKYTQVRGIVCSESSIVVPTYLYVYQYFMRDVAIYVNYETKIVLPGYYNPVPFIIDLVAPNLQFWVDRDASVNWGLHLYAKAWCL
jgi:hypothetical protein